MRGGRRYLSIFSTTRKCFSLPANGPGTLTRRRSGSNWRPEPFKVKFTPRNQEIKQTIIREGEQALKDLRKYERETKYTFNTFYQ
jgi:hypothetical protein